MTADVRKIPLNLVYGMAALLFLAVLPLPYLYYSVLRWIGLGFFWWAAVIVRHQHHAVLSWMYGGLALLFNPFLPIHLPKEIWAVVDIAAAILVLATSKRIGEEH